MKKFLITLMIGLCLPFLVRAQGNSNVMSFMYIDHTSNMSVSKMSQILKNAFNDARNYDIPTLFYMANMNVPFYAYIDGKSTNDDFVKFEKIIAELQEQRFHDIDSRTDLTTLMKLFEEHDFINEDGSFKYDSITWTFFIDQSFWDLQYNEKIIARLYYNMDMDDCYENLFHLKLYYSGEEGLKIDSEYPFGKKIGSKKLKKYELLKL